MHIDRSTPVAALAAAVLAAAPLSAPAAVVIPSNVADWFCTGTCGVLTGTQGDVSATSALSRYGFVSTAGSTATGVTPVAQDSTGGGRKGAVETNGSTIVSTSFKADKNAVLNIAFNYISTDGNSFDDYGWARLLDAGSGKSVAWLFGARSTKQKTGEIVPGGLVTDLADKSGDLLDFDPGVLTNYGSFQFTSKTASDLVDWSPLGASNQSCWETNAKGCGYTGWLDASYKFTARGDYRIEIGVTNWADELYDSGLAYRFDGLSSSAADYVYTAPAAVVAPPPPTLLVPADAGTPVPAATDLPEPSSLPLLALSLAGMAWAVRGKPARRARQG